MSVSALHQMASAVSNGLTGSSGSTHSTTSSTANGDLSGYNSQVLAILGSQWGDEGKGKLVDILAKQYDIIARFNGGANAGHTLVVKQKKYAFHLLPCGMLYDSKINLIGNGVVVDAPILLDEMQKLESAGVQCRDGRLLISDRAHLLFDIHKLIDGNQESALKDKLIGTTKKGIGPCYAGKATRNNVRVGELREWNEFEAHYRNLHATLIKQYGLAGYDFEAELKRYKEVYSPLIVPMIIDSVSYLYNELRAGKKLLAEGANAALLDLDHGTYPYVTSSSTVSGGIATGLGIGVTKVNTVIGVVKAYTTRVGGGPFPTELHDAVGESLRARGGEFGTTTGRPRRCGWLDIPVLQYSHALNNYNSINITKLDVLSDLPEIKIGVAYKVNGKRLPPAYMPSLLSELAQVEVEYETVPGWQSDIAHCKTISELPAAAQSYLKRIEELLSVPISWVGVGPGREDMATQGFQPQY